MSENESSLEDLINLFNQKMSAKLEEAMIGQEQPTMEEGTQVDTILLGPPWQHQNVIGFAAEVIMAIGDYQKMLELEQSLAKGPHGPTFGDLAAKLQAIRGLMTPIDPNRIGSPE